MPRFVVSRFTPIRALLALSALFATTRVFAEDSFLSIGVGETQEIKLNTLASAVHLDKKHVVRVNRGHNKAIIIFTGLKSGTVQATVTLDSGEQKNIKVKVTNAAAHKRRLKVLRENIAALKGLKAKIRRGKVVVSGRVLTRATLQTLEGLKGQNPCLVIDGTDKRLPKSNAVVSTINKVLVENDIGNIQAHAYGKIIVLEGSPKNKNEAELALRIAKMIHPEIESRLTEHSAAPSVSIDVMFVEVSKRNSKEFGLNGRISSSKTDPSKPALAEANARGQSGSQGRLNWKVGDLSTFLHMLQSRSASRVLSNPKLVTRSGEEAGFHSGGTVYFKVDSPGPGGTTRTEYLPIKYGIELGILPRLDRLGQIDTKISTAVTDLGAQKFHETLPEKSGSEVKTSVTIKDGQSILLSGLVNKKERKVTERVPLLADIPIVGELFKSRLIDNEEVELMILVTINRVGASDQKSTITSELWDRAEKDVEFSFFD